VSIRSTTFVSTRERFSAIFFCSFAPQLSQSSVKDSKSIFCVWCEKSVEASDTRRNSGFGRPEEEVVLLAVEVVSAVVAVVVAAVAVVVAREDDADEDADEEVVLAAA
jgi:hypothetical protein